MGFVEQFERTTLAVALLSTASAVAHAIWRRGPVAWATSLLVGELDAEGKRWKRTLCL